MNHLEHYVASHNSLETLFGAKPIKVPTNADECVPVFEKLVIDLSPENLTCDGELSHRALKEKSDYLHSVWYELESIYGRDVSQGEVYEWMQAAWAHG